MKALGYYREFPDSTDENPSIKESIRSVKDSSEELIANYLEKGHIFLAVPNLIFDVLDPSKGAIGSSSVITDGEWGWPQYLAYFVRNYHLELDSSFIDYVKKRQGVMTSEEDINWDALYNEMNMSDV